MARTAGSMNLVLPLTLLIFMSYNEPCRGHHIGDKATGHEKLIVILADGMRHDYLNDPDLKGFPRIFKEGVRAKYVTPIYPANSYPNWYTIVTGLYAESHGFVQNYMYDEKVKDTFKMIPDPNATKPYWWNEAEPIWVTAEKNGIKTAMYWWGGCEVEIRGRRPSACQEIKSYWEWPTVNDDVANAWIDVLDKFQKENYQLALVYYEAPDANGHRFGPDAPQTKQAVKDIDDLLDKLQEEMKKRKVDDQVSIVVVSDHGMTDVTKSTNITLDDVVKDEDIEMILDRGSLTMIRPYSGKVDKVYDDIKNANIKGLKVYKKEDIPEEFHLKNNNRTQEILVVVELGYFLLPYRNETKRVPEHHGSYSGFHGYNPYEYDEMRTIMYARGPILKKGFESQPIHQVDHYNVLCHLIGIEPLPNNGSWDRVKDMFGNSGMIARPLIWTYLGSLLVSFIFTRKKLL